MPTCKPRRRPATLAALACGLTVLATGAAAQAPPDAASPLDIFGFLDDDFNIGPWRLRGYLQVDFARYGQDPAGPPETDFRRGEIGGDPYAAQALDDGAALRRARIGGEGTFGKHSAYRVMFELGANGQKGDVQVAEVWVNYRKFAPYVIVVGAYPHPANMADATRFDSSLFLERPAAADLARNLGAGEGRVGITLRRTTPKWFWSTSLTGPVINPPEDATPRSAIVTRLQRTWAQGPDRRIHLGGSATYVLDAKQRRTDNDIEGFITRFQSTPEVRVDGTDLIDTGDLLAAHSAVLGLEFAAQRRNLYLQAEAFAFRVDRKDAPGIGNPRFQGWYVEGSWLVTGERRRFDPSRAAYGIPAPDRPIGGGGWGALELAVRYSRMDLNYHQGEPGLPPPPDGIRGGDQEIFAASALWYPRSRFRVMLSYMHVDVDRLNPAGPLAPQPFGPPPATPPVGVQIGQSLDVVALRFRYGF